jgi:hypothetical protein
MLLGAQHQIVMPGQGGVQVVKNDGRDCEQKERNMKSKTAGKFHARRLDEKKKTSDKKDSRRRPVE